MAKDPAVLFYTSDFLSGTFTMSNEQVGKYMRLLCLQHQKGQLTEKDMLNICVTYDFEVYSKFVKDGDFFYNERMKFESERRKKYSESRTKNRNSHTQIAKKQRVKNENTYVKHMETETETENETITDTEKDKRKKVELVFPYNSGEFMQLWSVMADGPKWKKKNQSALQASLKILSRYPENVAIEMMEKCIAGNWQGLVEPKNNYNGTDKKNGHPSNQDIQAAFNRSVNEREQAGGN